MPKRIIGEIPIESSEEITVRFLEKSKEEFLKKKKVRISGTIRGEIPAEMV